LDGRQNQGFRIGQQASKDLLGCVNNIKQGLDGHSAPVSEQRFKNQNGELCSTPAENARTVRDPFQKEYNIKSEPDPNVFTQIEQRPVQSELDAPPTHKEIRNALNAAKKDKAAGELKIPVEFWQILAEESISRMHLLNTYRRF
jgi:hypothetical protein